MIEMDYSIATIVFSGFLARKIFLSMREMPIELVHIVGKYLFYYIDMSTDVSKGVMWVLIAVSSLAL